LSNVLIAFNNRADAATLSGGSWLAALPKTNLQNRIVGKVARSTDDAVASTKFDVDITADTIIRVIGLIGHNLSINALYRIRGSSDSGFASSDVDTGWVSVWPPVYVSTDLDWQSLNWWSGRYLTDEILGYTWSLIYDIGSAKNLRYWRIEFDDTANTSGYVQVGRLFMGDAWQPAINMSYGAGISWETPTEVQEAIGGTEYFDARTPYRVAKFSTDWLTEDEAYSSAFDIQRRMGIDKEVIFLWNPEDTTHALRRQFLGRLRQLSAIENPYLDTHKAAWEIKEII